MLSLPETGFRARLLIAMLALIVLTTGGVTAVMMYNLFEEEQARAEEQLDVAERVANEVINTRNDLLLSNLQIVTRDFGLKSAIASRDRPTIHSALENHSARANADLAMIVSGEGELIASLSDAQDGATIPFPELFEQARKQGTVSAMARWKEDVYQLLIVPIEGAGLKAWMVAGFRLDNAFAQLIADLTNTEVAFQATAQPDGRILGQSLPASELGTRDALREADNASRIGASNDFFVRTMTLEGLNSPAVRIWLLRDRADALARYYTLIMEMGIVLAAALGIAAVVALVTARALGRPIFKLSRFAQALGDDRHTEPPSIQVQGEPRVLLHSLLTMRDRISEHERQIEHAATHDSLTGLPNWQAIRARFQHYLNAGQPVTVVAVDLPDIKNINEMLGFRFGDETLIATGLRLNAIFGAPGELARTGGSQFMGILPHLEREGLEKHLSTLKQRIETSVEVFGSPIQTHVTLAALTVPEQAGSIDEIQRRLDLTLERACHDPDRIALYVPGGDEEHLREIRLVRDLSAAIQEHSLHLHYQPKVALDSGRFLGVEALVRWQHPELGAIGPDEFIPLAESSGQTQALTDRVMAMAAEDARRWWGQGLDLKLAINLSALDLANTQLHRQVERHFADRPELMTRLTFEVTESAVMSDPTLARQTLEKLRDLGFKLSVDDFGTGYSSLAQLRSLPVHELKIDKSFILNLDTRPQDQLIVQSTIDMAHGLGLSVVAEGVENLGSWQLLRGWGCELAQGFFMARPMASDRLADWHRAFGERSGELVENSTVQNSETLQ